MSTTNELIDRLTDDYESSKQFYELRTETHLLPVNRDMVEIIIDNYGVIFIEGDTRVIEFWRILRNVIVKHLDSNDDLQQDIGAYEFQKELLTQGICGQVKIALIGIEENELALIDYGYRALEKDYVPIYWCWCHDHWSVNEHAKEALIKFKYTKDPDLTDFTIRIPNC